MQQNFRTQAGNGLDEPMSSIAFERMPSSGDMSAIRQPRMLVKDDQRYFASMIHRASGARPVAGAPELVR